MQGSGVTQPVKFLANEIIKSQKIINFVVFSPFFRAIWPSFSSFCYCNKQIDASFLMFLSSYWWWNDIITSAKFLVDPLTCGSWSHNTLTILWRHFIINKRTDTLKKWRHFVNLSLSKIIYLKLFSTSFLFSYKFMKCWQR